MKSFSIVSTTSPLVRLRQHATVERRFNRDMRPKGALAVQSVDVLSIHAEKTPVITRFSIRSAATGHFSLAPLVLPDADPMFRPQEIHTTRGMPSHMESRAGLKRRRLSGREVAAGKNRQHPPGRRFLPEFCKYVHDATSHERGYAGHALLVGGFVPSAGGWLQDIASS